MWTGCKFCLLIILLHADFCAEAQVSYQPEILAGHIVPNYPDYPRSKILAGAGVAIFPRADTSKWWKRLYPKAQTGLYLGGWDFGNKKIYGQEITAYPFVQFPVFQRHSNPILMRIGLGAAFFTRHYSEDNPTNAAIGSAVTWAFEASLYKAIHFSNGSKIYLAGKFLHGSNGHTQLPNFGLNSAALAIGLDFAKAPAPTLPSNKCNCHRWLLQIQAGAGLHEFGGTDGPVNGPKYGIPFVNFYASKEFNHKNLLKIGLAFRRYNSFSQYIEQHDLKSSPNSVSFILGHEFRMGRIGLDVDGLLHLYKPFYKTWYELFGENSKIGFLLHRWLGARIGFNLYAIPPYQKPATNLFLGVHLNTNNGEAEFSSISLGLERQL